MGIKRKGVVCASVSLLSLSVDAAGSLCGLDWQRYVGDSQLLPYSYPQGSLGSGRFFEAYNHVKQSLKDVERLLVPRTHPERESGSIVASALEA